MRKLRERDWSCSRFLSLLQVWLQDVVCSLSFVRLIHESRGRLARLPEVENRTSGHSVLSRLQRDHQSNRNEQAVLRGVKMDGIRIAWKFQTIPHTDKHVIMCFVCGVPNTIDSVRRWWNGQPLCECGQVIKNAPQEWKKN